MKNLKTLFFVGFLILAFCGCESDDEKYNGSPVGKDEIITLDALLETSVTAVMSNQKIPFKVTLPKAFADTVSVEVSTTNKSGVSTRVSVDVMPGKLTPDTVQEVAAAGGAIYNSELEMSVTAILLNTVEPGKHYLMKSNVIKLATGNTPVPSSNNTRLQLRFAWPDANSTLNNIRLNIRRPDGTSAAPPALDNASNGGSNGYRNFNILNDDTAIPGEYIFSIVANRLVTTPFDLPYRFIVRFPDGSSKLIQNVYPGLTLLSPERAVLKVTKVVNTNGTIQYTVEEIQS